MSQNILEIKDLFVQYSAGRDTVRAVNGINLTLEEGESLGLVGETGAGKTTTALSIMRLIPNPPGKITGGEILYRGENLMEKSEAEMRKIRGHEISMIFQEPMTALDPMYTIEDQINETLRFHTDMTRAQMHEAALEMLRKVKIPRAAEILKDYPHHLSGGMLQRVMIAIALINNPRLLIADEPTTALDVTIQAQILDLMNDLRESYDTSVIMITHDLGIVAEVCDTVAVMYAGRICERGTVDEIFYNPKHEYTKGLLRSIPKLDSRNQRLIPIAGSPVDLTSMPAGCAFASRCDCAMKICLTDLPEELPINENHRAACWMNVKRVYDEARKEGAAQ